MTRPADTTIDDATDVIIRALHYHAYQCEQFGEFGDGEADQEEEREHFAIVERLARALDVLVGETQSVTEELNAWSTARRRVHGD